MDILSKILELLNNRKQSQRALCEHLGIKEQVFTDWKAGRNKSYLKRLPEIANYFGVSVDYLLGNTDQKEKPATETGSGQNRELLDLIEQLTEEQRKLIIRQIKGILSDS